MQHLHAEQLPDISTLSLSSISDYVPISFPEKQQQREVVMDLLDQRGFIPEDLIETEVNWFYNSLGIDDTFFSKESAQNIVNLIHQLYAAKLTSFAKSQDLLYDFQNSIKNAEHGVFFETSGHRNSTFDNEIDDEYLDTGNFRLESFRSQVDAKNTIKLSFAYETKLPSMEDKSAKIQSVEELDAISDPTMIKITSTENKKLYSLVINEVLQRYGPVIKQLHSVDQDETRIVIGYVKGTTKRYYSALNTLLDYYNLTPSKIYVENFANDVCLISVYLNHSRQADNQLLQLSINQVLKETSLLYTLPDSSFSEQFKKKEFSLQESIYAHVGVEFVYHFINRLGNEFKELVALYSQGDSNLSALNNLKKKLRNETFTLSNIRDVFLKHKEIISKLYKGFADVHYISSKLEKTLSYQRLSKMTPFKNDEEFYTYLKKFVPNQHDALILETLMKFNQSILKTNFFVTRKVAISFRLKPDLILNTIEYPETPYGIFFVVGNGFKGFHIRFRDISRGGIRIVVSRNQDFYEINSKNVIDENYNLASTQQKKNKDIPEGGSKGVVLLNPESGIEPFIAFSKYTDAIIDILIKDKLKEEYVDLLGHPEILFFGPDEGTAGFVDWATEHARKRGAPWWKSFLTGKTPSKGGIPHDEYGMTSISVRTYVEKLYDVLKLHDSQIFKFQTGGPDGDLGSNEILLSSQNETYCAIVDGSGVLADPNGLDKNELIRLAKSRSMVSNYDKSLLSPQGFIVLVDEVDVVLPNGYIVSNGTSFRNSFHTELFQFFDRVDLFVPCGGRPNSIDLNNISSYIDENGNGRIKYIVEGANLFISQAAKVHLEQHGTVVFKDASTNKGGVTSSSLEVLASLALDDNDFVTKFTEQNGELTPLYKEYVKFVQAKIHNNALLEFDQLWKIHHATGTPISELSNVLSAAINKLNDELINSDELWLNDVTLKNYLLLDKIIPKLLIDVAGKDKILAHIPETYLKALLSSYLSSLFVYKNGIDINLGKFLEFIGDLKRESAAAATA